MQDGKGMKWYTQDNSWFLLSLPPINLYTANLLQPYYNGVKQFRMEDSVVQPETKTTDKVLDKARAIVDNHNAKTSCVKLCKLNKETQCCYGCGRSIEDIINAGMKRRENVKSI